MSTDPNEIANAAASVEAIARAAAESMQQLGYARAIGDVRNILVRQGYVTTNDLLALLPKEAK